MWFELTRADELDLVGSGEEKVTMAMENAPMSYIISRSIVAREEKKWQ
jgi:hypothetical protein